MTVTCCSECYRFISNIDQKASELWINLCTTFVKFEGNFTVVESLAPWQHPQLKKLEELGYITTADKADGANVRVNGYEIMELTNDDLCLETFCIQREKHLASWV